MKYNKVQINTLLIHPDATYSIYIITKKSNTHFDYISYSNRYTEIIYRTNVSSKLWNADNRIWIGLEPYKGNYRNRSMIRTCFKGGVEYRNMI